MWIGDVYQVYNDIVSFAGSTQKKTNFPVKIDDIVVYYASKNFYMKRFMATEKYNTLLAWHNYFIVK